MRVHRRVMRPAQGHQILHRVVTSMALPAYGARPADLAVVGSLAFAGTEVARARVLPWRE